MRKPILLFVLVVLALAAFPALAAGPTLTVSGPASVTIVSSCQNVVWTATASGGVTPYSLYEWRRNGSLVGGNSTTLTLNYCTTPGQTTSFTDTISCTVTDSNGREGTGSKDTIINLQG
ncbi:MAG TPA: hypothetical protein VKK31_22190 [Thermoanaerobaculia bacterium]|nr:hypothetical protein [Thermoanaerobaculia bacterium]